MTEFKDDLMDKTTRILLLYSKLMRGEKINKFNFCMETESLSRTFDRDIEDVRVYLSELFSNEELIYDRQENVYYFSDVQSNSLEDMEYLFIERMLLDTGVLRADEMQILLKHLALNTENVNQLTFREINYMKKYEEPIHEKAILKMHGDLTAIITKKSVIKIKYIKLNKKGVEREVIPCTIKYDLGYLYLIAFLKKSDKPYPAYFRLDRLHSFEILRSQTMDEKRRVDEYMKKYFKGIVQMYGGAFIEIRLSCKKAFYPYIHDKFRTAVIIQENDDVVNVKLKAFEGGFVKWMMSQPVDLVQIIEPKEVKQKMISEAKKMISIYTEEE